MADIKKIQIDGTSYDIFDSTARSTASTANAAAQDAKTAAETAQTAADSAATQITTIKSQAVKISYDTTGNTMVIKTLDAT